jgi:hypothetical protein
MPAQAGPPSEVNRMYEETFVKLRDAPDDQAAQAIARDGAAKIGKVQYTSVENELAKRDRKNHGVEEPAPLEEGPTAAEAPPVPAEISFEPVRKPAAKKKP